jgi:hypothetical protein
MKRTETFTKEVSYCDICLRQGMDVGICSASYGNICFVCKKDICQDHTSITIPDYANTYKVGSTSSIEICQDCVEGAEEFVHEIYDLNEECIEKYIRVYEKWRAYANSKRSS